MIFLFVAKLFTVYCVMLWMYHIHSYSAMHSSSNHTDHKVFYLSLYFVLSVVIYTFWSFGIILCNSVYSKIEHRLSLCQGALPLLHLLLLPMDSLNKTQAAVFTLPLHIKLQGDHINTIYVCIPQQAFSACVTLVAPFTTANEQSE